jgi:hypothetical protein
VANGRTAGNIAPAPRRYDAFSTCSGTASAPALCVILIRMFGDGSLMFSKFAMKEPLPLVTIHDAVIYH